MSIKFCNMPLIAITLASVLSCGDNVQNKPEPIKVYAMEVCQTHDIKTVPYIGRVAASRTVSPTPAYPGTLASIDFSEGELVEEGEQIASIHSQTINSSLEMAQATLSQAQDGYERMMQMYKEGGVPEIQKIEIETKLAQAQAAYKAAADALDKCSVKAPFKGVVEKVYQEPGIEISPAQALMKISDINTITVNIPVPENEISGVKTGDSADVYVPALDLSFSANVSVKGVSASKISHTYNCILKPQTNIKGLLPGMVCKVYLKNKSNNLIIIPLDCVMTDNLGRYVWLVDKEGVVSKRRIEVDEFSSKGIIVTSGLKEGDAVVIQGRRKISTGMKVEVVKEKQQF